MLAGFAMTSFAEIDLPHNAFYAQKACLHLFVTVSICANLMCTASTTFVSVWGSGKALRGKDGSMDKAVEGMHAERCEALPRGRSRLARSPSLTTRALSRPGRPPPHRAFIFTCFGVGLVFTLLALMAASWILMSFDVAVVASLGILWCIYIIIRQARPPLLLLLLPHLDSAPLTRQAWRLHHKFKLGDTETVRFDDILQSRVVPRAMEAEEDEPSEDQQLLPQKLNNGVRSPARGRGYEV